MTTTAGVKPGTPKHEIPLWKKIAAGAGAGAISSAAANPTALVKVRLQTDGMLKGSDGNFLPKKYTGMGHAFVRRAALATPRGCALPPQPRCLLHRASA